MNIKKKNISQQEEKNLSEISIFQSFNNLSLSEVVVDGAILQCSMGSHYKYLKIPDEHGVMAMGKTVALESDCLPGKNISDFGICAIKTMLVTSKENFINATEIPGTIKEGALTYGIPCTFMPIGGWKNTDEKLHVYNQQSLQEEEKVLTASNVVCAYGANIDPKVFSGQLAFWKDDSDYLSDHDICKIEDQEGNPVQLTISKNSITVNAYIKYINADNKRKKLIKKGIKQWNNNYEYVFGHKVKFKIKIHEVSEEDTTQKAIIIKCISEEDCQAIEEDSDIIERDENGLEKISEMVENILEFDYTDNKTLLLYPIQTMGRFDSLGRKYVKDFKYKKNGKTMIKKVQINDVREVTDKEYINIVSHEFGHALGLSDAYNEIPDENNVLRKEDESGNIAVQGNDVMLTGNYGKQVSFSCINIQMIIAAAKEKSLQFYSTYSGTIKGIPATRVKSKGADKTGVFEKCQNKKEED